MGLVRPADNAPIPRASGSFRPPPGRTPLWATALTAALLAAGFGRGGRPTSDEQIARSVTSAEGGHDRGRHADSPAEIPARGWKDILLRVYKEIADDRVVSIAAGVTYYAILAIFPAIASLVAVYGLFADSATIAGQLDTLSGLLPPGALQVIEDQLNRLVSQDQKTLGLAFVGSLALSLWSVNAGIKALFDALNIVYDENEKRGFFRLNAVSLLFTLGAVLFIAVALMAVVALPVILRFIGLESATEWLLNVLRWPAFFIAVVFAITLIYRHGPSRGKAQWRWLTWGSVIAALLWIGLSMLFSWYAANMGSYEKTYGSLGAVIGFMVWIWLSTIVILFGAEIDAEMEHQTVKDTTTGQPKPLGRRGATMADTVGAAQR